MKKLILPLTLSLFTIQSTFGSIDDVSSVSEVDLSSKLNFRNQFYTTFLQTERDMNDIAKNDALQVWYGVKVKEQRLPKFRLMIAQQLKQYVISQKVIDWAGHYQHTGQYDRTASVLASYYYNLAAHIEEVAHDPRLDAVQTDIKTQAIRLAPVAKKAAEAAKDCLFREAKSVELALATLGQKCLSAALDPKNKTGEILQKMYWFAHAANTDKKYKGANQVLSFTGFIPGNKVEQILENYYDADFINYMAPMTKAVIEKYGEMTVEDYKSKMTDNKVALTDFFTTADGFPAAPRDHKVWSLTKTNNGKKNIYGDVFHAIENAKQSVFIDVFFLGGSIGATLAKRIIERVQENKDLWVYILNDRNNPLGYNPEMQPVYNYLRAYAENFPQDRIAILVPQVELKRTAFPHIADLIMKDATLQAALTTAQRQGLKAQLSFYPKGKSDHSKVIVVDGLDQREGIAFVGSKNYTDSSGGVAYDEVTKIQGPAVPAILDSYYHDLKLAMKLASQNSPEYISGLAKASGVKNGDMDSQVESILSKVDVLNRSGKSPQKDLTWPMQGSTTLMIGENNAYGTIRTALPQDIAAIRSAEKQIIISEQFIYEPSVVRALKEQVRDNPNLRVYIVLADMADHLNKMKEFSHIPNVSFVDEFTNDPTSRIQVKWKKVPAADLKALEEIKTNFGLGYAPEYHLKSISVDGVLESQIKDCGQQTKLVNGLIGSKPPLLISGSANKDVMTMTGGFREYQVVVYDSPASVAHDCQFWSRWKDSDQTEPVRVSSMNLPANVKAKGLDEARFNQLVRDVVNGVYNIVSGYFSH